MHTIQRVLISVTDKTGAVEFARELSGMGAEIVSTGGTARLLREAGVTVKDVAEVTGFPEIYQDWGDDEAYSLELGRGECAV